MKKHNLTQAENDPDRLDGDNPRRALRSELPEDVNSHLRYIIRLSRPVASLATDNLGVSHAPPLLMSVSWLATLAPYVLRSAINVC